MSLLEEFPYLFILFDVMAMRCHFVLKHINLLLQQFQLFLLRNKRVRLDLRNRGYIKVSSAHDLGGLLDYHGNSTIATLLFWIDCGDGLLNNNTLNIKLMLGLFNPSCPPQQFRIRALIGQRKLPTSR